MTAVERVERFVEAYAKQSKHGLHPELVYSLQVFVDEDLSRDLLLSDLRELIDHIDALQERIDALPPDPCGECGAVACCCAYDYSTQRCAAHGPKT